MDNIRQGLAVFDGLGNIDYSSDIGPAMAYKNPYLWLLLGDIPFRRIYPFFGKISSPVVKEFTDLGARSACAEDRLGNIDRTLEASSLQKPPVWWSTWD